MTEKTLSQISKEAALRRGQSATSYEKARNLRLAADDEARKYHESDTQDFLTHQSAYDQQVLAGASEEELANLSNERQESSANNYRAAASRAGARIIDAVMFEEAGRFNDQQALKHYDANKAAYHEIAAMEAHMDGVEINIDQTQGVAEAINVKVIHDQK